MTNIKEVHSKPTPYVFWGVAAMLGDAIVVVVHTCPRAVPLATITMRNLLMGLFSSPMMSMGLRLAAGAPL